jgi:TRAP-type C4-dicarboxylate transport system permease small subunit
MAALVSMLGLVTADIVGAKALRMPVSGAMDLSSLLALLAIAFSTAQTHRMGRHIKVDFVTVLLPEKVREIIRFISTSLCVLFFATALWRSVLCAGGMRTHHEASLTVKIPLAPFAYALALAFLPMILVLLLELRSIAKGDGQ